MSTTYEQTTVTQTSSSGASPSIGVDMGYLKSIPGILKIIEIVLSLIVLICSSTGYYVRGYGWIQFVAVAAMITISILFVFHFLRIIFKLPGPWVFIEFIIYVVFTVFWVISFIVAVAHGYYFFAALIATAVFTVFTTVVFAVDTFFNFRGWQAVQHPATSGNAGAANTTTTTTTTTAYETRTQY